MAAVIPRVVVALDLLSQADHFGFDPLADAGLEVVERDEVDGISDNGLEVLAGAAKSDQPQAGGQVGGQVEVAVRSVVAVSDTAEDCPKTYLRALALVEGRGAEVSTAGEHRGVVLCRQADNDPSELPR